MLIINVINQHYDAIVQKNLPLILDKYDPSEETYVILEGPRLTTLGYEKIKKGWTDFCASPLKLLSIEWMEGPFSQTTAEMGWAAGIIRLKVDVHGKSFENIFRATFVLVRHEGDWKIRHEHVSGALSDPYGIGDWLKR
jgi:ketosteroid isomerase-like protein